MKSTLTISSWAPSDDVASVLDLAPGQAPDAAWHRKWAEVRRAADVTHAKIVLKIAAKNRERTKHGPRPKPASRTSKAMVSSTSKQVRPATMGKRSAAR